MNSNTKPTTLIEHIADWHTGLIVDRTNRTVKNVALAGMTSKNGYRYTEQALREAAALYNEKPVFLDHALDKSRPHQRSTRDLVGTIVNPRYESGRIRGDIRVLDTDSGRTFLALSESDAPGVGMSHVVLARRTAADGAVERIHDVVSVDAVVFPATTTTFRESHNASTDSATGSRTNVTGDTDTNPSADPTSESQSSTRHDQLRQLLRERDQLLGQLRAIREREAAVERQRHLDEQLRQSGLPDYAVTTEFRRQLSETDEATRTALIAERRRLIDTASSQFPRSIERSDSRQRADGDRAFIAAIKRTAS